tara:strand:+ start:320 stop:460 length:141 start_codon:yes stop_codon:yes gene_type:complete
MLEPYKGKSTNGGAQRGAPTNPETTPSGFTTYTPRMDWNNPDKGAH